MLEIPNVYEENCPTRIVLDHIADKWTALILWKLTNGPIRFNHPARHPGHFAKGAVADAHSSSATA
jgi:DNA-binding HxlR family transcriptional regulator